MIELPRWLSFRPFSDNDCQLIKALANSFGYKYFGDIKYSDLQQYGSSHKELQSFYRLIRVLGLYGVVFKGNAARYSSHLFETPSLLSFNNKKCLCVYELGLSKNISVFLTNLGLETGYHLHGIRLDTLSLQISIDYESIFRLFEERNFAIITSEADISSFYTEEPLVEVSVQLDLGVKSAIFDPISLESEDALSLFSEQGELTLNALDLNVRAKNVLLRNNVTTLQRLLELSEEDLRNFKHCGKDTVSCITNALSAYDLSLKRFSAPILHTRAGDLRLIGVDKELCDLLSNAGIDTLDSLFQHSYNSISTLLDSQEAVISRIKNYFLNLGFNVFPVNAGEADNLIEIICKQPSLEALGSKILEEEWSQRTTAALKRLNFKFIWQFYLRSPREILAITSILIYDEISRKLKQKQLPSLGYKLDASLLLKVTVRSFLTLPTCLEKHLDAILKNERYVEIFRRRVLNLDSQQTLENIGQELGVTRERVRQIQAKAEIRVLDWCKREIQDVIAEITRNLNASNTAYPFDQPENFSLEYRGLLEKLVDGSFIIDWKSNILWPSGLNVGNNGEEVYTKIVDYIRDRLPEQCQEVSYDKIYDLCSDALAELSLLSIHSYEAIPKRITAQIIKDHFKETGDGTFRLDDYSIAELAIYTFGQVFPNGIAIYKDGSILWEKMCEALPELRQRGGNRYIAQLCLRYPKKILLWGKGFYIHIDRVNLDWEIIDDVIEQCILHFDQGIPELKVNLLFQQNAEILQIAGVPNSHALYSLFRLKENPRVIAVEWPRLFDAQVGRDSRQLLEILEDYIKCNKQAISKADLIGYFCTSCGWKPYELEQTLVRASQIIPWSKGKYLHRENLVLNKEKLLELSDTIATEILNSDSPIHIQAIKNKHCVLWAECCAPELPLRAMVKLLSEIQDQKFKIEGKTHITTHDYSSNVAVPRQIRDWAYNYGDYVTKNQLVNEFTVNRGYPLGTILFSLPKTGLLEYTESDLVHPDLIGLNEHFLNTIIQIVRNANSESESQNIPHTRLSWILENFGEQLPALKNNIVWTSALLGSLIEKAEIGLVLSNVFVINNNPFDIEDLDDLIAYILVKNFPDTRCSLRELEKLLQAEEVLPLNSSLPKNEVFFDGSSVELVDDGLFVQLSKVGRQRFYSLAAI
jgi:hypothetical protein